MSPNCKFTMAIAYDFDGTLAPGYMQHHSFVPELEIQPAEFWSKVKKIAKDNDMDEILAYMHLMLHEANYKRISIRRDSLINHGKGIALFHGVQDWFSRINSYALERCVKMEHYIISSGLREMIYGTSISKEFEYIFASGFMYNQDDIAIWPAVAVNYTNKTQHLFRINKDVKNIWNNEEVNKYYGEKERPVDFHNMIYIGDGETDVPAMKMVSYQGGTAIAVYDPSSEKAKRAADDLLVQDRANHSLPANYAADQGLDKTVKSIIDGCVSRYDGQKRA